LINNGHGLVSIKWFIIDTTGSFMLPKPCFRVNMGAQSNRQLCIVSSTVLKALELLSLFSQTQAELGLSELARLAERDKATVHRMLQALAKHGLVEQDAQSRLYRLGVGTLRLARSREASFPTSSLVMAPLLQLAEATGETSHASLIAGGSLATVGLVKGTGALHVSIDAGESLPFHATASGIACLAFLDEAQIKTILKQKLKSYTAKTLTSTDEVLSAVAQARSKGYALSDQSFESDVVGIAAPLFSSTGTATGAVAVATPAHRLTREVRNRTIAHVMQAAILISQRLGAEAPQSYVNLTRKAAA
jgi:IclR family transcriptional regulator, acetate operon repressor